MSVTVPQVARIVGVPPKRIRRMVKWYALYKDIPLSELIESPGRYALPDDFVDFVREELMKTQQLEVRV